MSDTPKLRLEDKEVCAERLDLAEAEDWAEWIERSLWLPQERAVMLRALIALARAAKREVRCTCQDRIPYSKGAKPERVPNPLCPAHRICPDTAAELERWE